MEIARRAGVSEGTLFYRYRTKDGLLAAVISRETAANPELADLCSQPAGGDIAGNIERIVMSILEDVARTFPFLELIELAPLAPRVLKDSLPRDGVPPPVRDQKLIEKYIRAEAAAGRIRDIDPATVAQTIVGAAIFHFRFGTPGSVESRRAFARFMAEMVTRGIISDQKTRSTLEESR